MLKISNKQALRLHATLRLDPKGDAGIALILFDNFHALALGLTLNKLNPASFDMPMGFKTGAGVIFGASGGVTEAVLRYAVGKITGKNPVDPEFEEIRGE